MRSEMPGTIRERCKRTSGIANALCCTGTRSLCEVLAGLGRVPSFCYVVPYNSGHRSTPRVIAALAGFVHDRQSAADYEHNHDKNT
jgi:hypothetical protein